jgi:nicotinic acid mononucleotide adenylyltransferase
MRYIGIYPGTFDSVHAGHIAFALSALKQCRLN